MHVVVLGRLSLDCKLIKISLVCLSWLSHEWTHAVSTRCCSVTTPFPGAGRRHCAREVHRDRLQRGKASICVAKRWFLTTCIVAGTVAPRSVPGTCGISNCTAAAVQAAAAPWVP